MLPTGYVGSLENESYPTSEEEEEEELEEEELEEEEESGTALASALHQELFNPWLAEVVFNYGLLMRKLFNISVINLKTEVASVAS